MDPEQGEGQQHPDIDGANNREAPLHGPEEPGDELIWGTTKTHLEAEERVHERTKHLGWRKKPNTREIDQRDQRDPQRTAFTNREEASPYLFGLNLAKPQNSAR